MKITNRKGRAFGIVEFTQFGELTDSGKSEKGYHLTSRRYTQDELDRMQQETYIGVTNIFWPLNEKRFKLIKKTTEEE